MPCEWCAVHAPNDHFRFKVHTNNFIVRYSMVVSDRLRNYFHLCMVLYTYDSYNKQLDQYNLFEFEYPDPIHCDLAVSEPHHCTGYAPAENGDWILFDLGDWVMLRVIGNCFRLLQLACSFLTDR